MEFKGQIQEEVLEKIYAFCAYQERCIKDVERKLYQLEINEQYWTDYINHLMEERFLDESRFVEAFVRGKFKGNQWGKIKISHGLRQKGINDKLINKGLDSIKEEDYEELVFQLAAKKWSSLKGNDDWKKKQQVYRFLAQRGFEPSLISSALDQLK